MLSNGCEFEAKPLSGSLCVTHLRHVLDRRGLVVSSYRKLQHDKNVCTHNAAYTPKFSYLRT